MTERSARGVRVVALAAAVLAGHLWLLGAAPAPARAGAIASVWQARTLEAPVPLPGPVPGPIAKAAAPGGTGVKTEPAIAAAAPAAARGRDATPPAQQVPSGKGGESTPVRAAQVAATADPHSSAKHAVALPPPMLLHYRVNARARGFEVNGEARLQWRHDGREYEAMLQLSAPFLPTRTQRSNGLITDEGIAPLRFADRSRHEEAAHFQREAGKVTFSSNRPEVPLQPGAQDRLTVMLQLGALIAGAPQKHLPGSSIVVQTASTRDAELWTFRIERFETLQLPGGEVEALKLSRAPRHEWDLLIELWLAPGMDYVPVRVRLTQPNGDWVDQQWSSTDRG